MLRKCDRKWMNEFVLWILNDPGSDMHVWNGLEILGFSLVNVLLKEKNNSIIIIIIWEE